MTLLAARQKIALCFHAFLLGAILGLAICSPAQAERADRDKPTNISYDHGVWDDLNQVYLFTGNVILTKGTILLRCDRLTVRQDPEGYDFATASMDAPGALVYFHQKREGFPDQYIEGVGERIEYDERNSDVKIFSHALVKRLDADVAQDEMRGDTIEYNSDSEKYHVEAGASGGRAHAIIAPPRPVTPGATGLPPNTQSTIQFPNAHPESPAPQLELKTTPSLKEKPNE